MAQVSKTPIKKDTWDRIFDLFLETLVQTKDKKKFDNFIQEFFSPTERIVFAKRLAAIVLLSKGQDYQSIRYVLHLSPPTIAKLSISLKYGNGGIKPVVDDILARQENKIALEELKGLFDLPKKGDPLMKFNKLKIERERKIKTLKDSF